MAYESVVFGGFSSTRAATSEIETIPQGLETGSFIGLSTVAQTADRLRVFILRPGVKLSGHRLAFFPILIIDAFGS
ncbi:MAG: hypothetical protein WCE82_04545 [Halobacteriota archaeon]